MRLVNILILFAIRLKSPKIINYRTCPKLLVIYRISNYCLIETTP